MQVLSICASNTRFEIPRYFKYETSPCATPSYHYNIGVKYKVFSAAEDILPSQERSRFMRLFTYARELLSRYQEKNVQDVSACFWYTCPYIHRYVQKKITNVYGKI
jgi:hypothetical protein